MRVRVNGEVRDVDEEIKLDRYKQHTIEVVVDRLVVPDQAASDADGGTNADVGRIADSVEQALKLGSGYATIQVVDGAVEHAFTPSTSPARLRQPVASAEIEPRTFSFNSPHGACPTCTGLGHRHGDRP